MSEIKRVALNTLEPQKVNDKVIKKQCKTLRISVILPESNEDNCPEYNYKDQLAAVEAKIKKLKDSKHAEGTENGLDPFGETDDDVRKIALEMEAKYGTGVTGGKCKRKDRKGDYADIGMGYDESDSFIDNTDGYDEIIPKNVTTLHGGFYINCGALEFKTDSEISSSESEDDDPPKKNRKRLLNSIDSDSETADTSQAEKKPKLLSSKNNMQQAIKKKLFPPNKIQVKKRRPIDPLKKTVKDLLREKREDLNMSIPAELRDIEANMEKDSLKENKVPMSISSVTDAIESVLKQVVDEQDYDNNQNKQNVDTKSEQCISKNEGENSEPQPMEADSSQGLNKSEKQEVMKLPENLPPDIMSIVDKIKEAALSYKGEGKKAFFTDDVNALLLSLEKKCRILGKSSKLRVYEHLSSYVICRKETLIKRAKNLAFEDETKRLGVLKVKLKDTIDATMPSLITKYEEECQKILQKKFSKDNITSEENKTLKLPRRHFQWTENSKRLIKDILSLKKRCLLLEGKQKDMLEEHVVEYLRSSILPLWPEGWMYMNNLKKVNNSMTDSTKSMDLMTCSSGTKTSQHSNKISNNTVEKLEGDVQLLASKYPPKNIFSASATTVKENDKPKVDPHQGSTSDTLKQQQDENNMFKPYADNSKSYYSSKGNFTNVEKPSDLLKGSTFDMFKPYVSEAGKLPDHSKQKNNNDMFKPYTEGIANVEPKSDVKKSPQTDRLAHTNKISSHSEKTPESPSLLVEKRSADSHERVVGHGKEPQYPESSRYMEKPRHTENARGVDKSRVEKQWHKEKTPHLEYPNVDSVLLNSHKVSYLSSETVASHSEKLTPHTLSCIEKPSDLSKQPKHKELLFPAKEKSKDFSKYEMFKPYVETPKSHTADLSKQHRSKDHYRSNDVIKQQVPKDDSPSSRHCKSSDLPQKMLEDTGVIVKNMHQSKEEARKPPKDDRKDHNAVLSKVSHCQQGIDLTDRRKKLPDAITPDILMERRSDFFQKSSNKHLDYHSSTPAKSDGDDIQMVMENLKALQKLSCSPIKTENSSSSPVSVIAYNKKVNCGQKSDSNSGKGDLGAAYQDEFQKQFINSLQQMAANPSTTKTNFNRCS